MASILREDRASQSINHLQVGYLQDIQYNTIICGEEMVLSAIAAEEEYKNAPNRGII